MTRSQLAIRVAFLPTDDRIRVFHRIGIVNCSEADSITEVDECSESDFRKLVGAVKALAGKPSFPQVSSYIASPRTRRRAGCSRFGAAAC